MEISERLSADYATQGASAGPHPMKLWRDRAGRKDVLRARDLHILPHGLRVTVGGMVICRQRPGAAKGPRFISLEDETRIANLFVPAATFQRLRLVITTEPCLLARGRLQISERDQPAVYVMEIETLPNCRPEQFSGSHDFC